MARSPDEMGIQEYQDFTFLINDAPDRRLTDEQILADWQARFPGRQAKVFAGSLKERLSQVQGIRRLYNHQQANEHGRRDDLGRVIGPPDHISLPYEGGGTRFAYSAAWLEASLAGRNPEELGVPPDVTLRSGRSLRPATPVQPWTAVDLSTLAAGYLHDLLRMKGRPLPLDSSSLAPLFARYGSLGVAAAREQIGRALDCLGLPSAGQRQGNRTPEADTLEVLERLLIDRPEVTGELLQEPAQTVESPPLVHPAAEYFEAAPVTEAGASPTFYAQIIAKDWRAIHEANTRLGTAGEQWVLELERMRLEESGRADLAGRVEWVSQSQGDGLGYDIASYEDNGDRRLIEVKTTSINSRHRPFFVSSNELRCSEELSSSYCLYRVYGFPSFPRVYILAGSLTHTCTLTPTTYAAQPAGQKTAQQ